MNGRLAGRSANLRMYHGNHSSPAADQRLHAMAIAGEPDLPALDAVEQMELVGGHKLASARGRVPLRKPINSDVLVDVVQVTSQFRFARIAACRKLLIPLLRVCASA